MAVAKSGFNFHSKRNKPFCFFDNYIRAGRRFDLLSAFLSNKVCFASGLCSIHYLA